MKQLDQEQIVAYQNELESLRYQVSQIKVEFDDVYTTNYVGVSTQIISGIFATIIFGFISYVLFFMEWYVPTFLVGIVFIGGIVQVIYGAGVLIYREFLKEDLEYKTSLINRIYFIENELAEHESYMRVYGTEEETLES